MEYRLYIKSGLQVSRISISGSFETFEGMGVKIVSGSIVWNIFGIYRPPPAPNAQFFSELRALCAELALLPGRMLLCGDFNCPGNTCDMVDSRLYELTESFGMNIFPDVPTRMNTSGTSGNLLDLLIHNAEDGVVGDVSTVDSGFSDHLLGTAAVHFPVVKARVISFTSRNLKQIDYGVLQEELESCSFVKQPAETVNEFINQMQNDVVSVLDRLAPVRTTKKRVGNPGKRSLSTEAVMAKRYRRRCEKKLKKSRSAADRLAYRDACRRANELIIKSNQETNQERLDSVKGDQKQTWKIANDILHRDGKSKPETADPVVSRKLCSDFKSFFVDKIKNIGINIASRLSKCSSVLIHLTPFNVVRLDVFRQTSTSEVTRIINSMKSKNSPRDVIPTIILKRCVMVFAPAMAYLANLSFSSGVFPDEFKIGHVLPLLKKGGLDPRNPANYRPITNLSTLSKNLEKLVLSRLREHVQISENFNDLQSAYRPDHSTETAILKMTNDLKS